MAIVEIVLPRMGESIIEATITRWLKKEGDKVAEDETVVEIATDKVDSEIPAPANGIITKLLFKEGDVVAVGVAIAHIDTGGEPSVIKTKADENKIIETEVKEKTYIIKKEEVKIDEPKNEERAVSETILSPLVKSIAKEENISADELESIVGTGKDGRVTKQDLMSYISSRKNDSRKEPALKTTEHKVSLVAGPNDEVIEMDRMRKLIADHMILSKHTSAHVTSFIEIDVTNIVKWRMAKKESFEKQEKEKLTYTPVFIEATARTIKEYPMINSSLDGTKIIIRKNINIGMAAALPSGNLIVPVIKNADRKSMTGLVKEVNDLANRARLNKLLPDEIQGGTFTLTNLGTFDTLAGTPVINQPQVAILAVGAIQKKPVVLETPQGDVIAIRNIMIASLSYDHRVVDGALGGMFLKRFKNYLENFDVTQGF